MLPHCSDQPSPKGSRRVLQLDLHIEPGVRGSRVISSKGLIQVHFFLRLDRQNSHLSASEAWTNQVNVLT